LFAPHTFLGTIYAQLGWYKRSATEFQLALDIFPDAAMPYENLESTQQAEGQYDQAEALMQRAQQKKFQDPLLHVSFYELALLRSDTAALQREREWMAQNEDDPFVVGTQTRNDLFAGNLSRAHQRTQHAVNMMRESNVNEAAANMLLTEATAEALCGETSQARETIAAVTRLADSKTIKSNVARVMALNGQGREAQQIMDRLVRENPSDTLLNAIDAPLVLAASQLRNHQADQALRTLDIVKPYEFGTYANLLPSYLRATAHLQLLRATEAATEFKAVLDHHGVAPMATQWEMSQLGLARSYALQGDIAKAKTAYSDFLDLWKDADPDIPALKQAKSEYAKLQ